MAYVLFDVVDPLNDPAPSALERLLWRLLGVLDYANRSMTRLLESGRTGGRAGLPAGAPALRQPVRLWLHFFQLTDCWDPTRCWVWRRRRSSRPTGSAAHRAGRSVRAAHRALGRPQRPVPRLLKLGLTDDWRQLALSLFTPADRDRAGQPGLWQEPPGGADRRGLGDEHPGAEPHRLRAQPRGAVQRDWSWARRHHGLLSGLFHRRPAHHQYLQAAATTSPTPATSRSAAGCCCACPG